MCSRQPSLLPWMDNSQISKNYFLRCLFVSTIIHLQRSYICWLDAIGLGSLNSTGVSKQNTHIIQTLRKRYYWKELVSMKISDTSPFLKQPLPILLTLPSLLQKSEPPFFYQCVCIYNIPIPIYLSIFLPISKEIKLLLFDSSFILTW